MVTTINPRVGTHQALILVPELFAGEDGLKQIHKFLSFNRKVSQVQIETRSETPFVRFRYTDEDGKRIERIAPQGLVIVKDRKTDVLTIHSEENFLNQFDTYPPRTDKILEALGTFIQANFPGFYEPGDKILGVTIRLLMDLARRQGIQKLEIPQDVVEIAGPLYIGPVIPAPGDVYVMPAFNPPANPLVYPSSPGNHTSEDLDRFKCTPTICAKRTVGNCDLGKCQLDGREKAYD